MQDNSYIEWVFEKPPIESLPVVTGYNDSRASRRNREVVFKRGFWYNGMGNLLEPEESVKVGEEEVDPP